MKKVFAILFLILAFLMLEGCTAAATEFPIPVTTVPTEPLVTAAPTEPLATIAVIEPPATEVPKDTQPDPTQAPTVNIISREEAIDIALRHAGVASEKATRVECEYDVDDGVKEYEVEFHSGKYEYNYDIHAETGKIRFWDKEIDD